MERGDIYLVSLDPTLGHEQQETRLVLVVSPTPFKRLTKTPAVLLITCGGNFACTAGFAVPLMGGRTATIGIVRCDQPVRLTCIPGVVENWKTFHPTSWRRCWHGGHLSSSELSGEGRGT